MVRIAVQQIIRTEDEENEGNEENRENRETRENNIPDIPLLPKITWEGLVTLFYNPTTPFMFLFAITIISYNLMIKTAEQKLDHSTNLLLSIFMLIPCFLMTNFSTFSLNFKCLFGGFFMAIVDIVVIYAFLSVLLNNSLCVVLSIFVCIVAALNAIYATISVYCFMSSLIFIVVMFIVAKIESIENCGGVITQDIDTLLNNGGSYFTIIAIVFIPLRIALDKKLRSEETTKNYLIIHSLCLVVFACIFGGLNIPSVKSEAEFLYKNIYLSVPTISLLFLTVFFYVFLYEHISYYSVIAFLWVWILVFGVLFYVELFNNFFMRTFFERKTLLLFLPMVIAFFYLNISTRTISKTGETPISSNFMHSLFGPLI